MIFEIKLNDNNYRYFVVVILIDSQLEAKEPFLDGLKEKVRHGTDADNPQVLSLWFLNEELLIANLNVSLRWQRYWQQALLLLEVYADDLVPKQWQILCLDNLYRPLMNLQRMACDMQQKQQLKHLIFEIRAIEQYRSTIFRGSE